MSDSFGVTVAVGIISGLTVGIIGSAVFTMSDNLVLTTFGLATSSVLIISESLVLTGSSFITSDNFVLTGFFVTIGSDGLIDLFLYSSRTLLIHSIEFHSLNNFSM
jgi:hypothetical protein